MHLIATVNGTEIPVYLGWQWDPVLIGSLVTLAVAYLLAVGPLRSRIAPGEAFPKGKALMFFSALLITYLAEGSPLHDLSEVFLFSAHMVQHLILMYFGAPLLIWGTPEWLWRPLLLNRLVRPVATLLGKAVVAGLVYTLFLSVWHFPFFYEAGLRNSSIHHTQHIFFLWVCLVAWWPVMSPLKEIPRLHYGTQIVYLFVTSTVLQLPLFAIITFTDQAFYAPYIAAPRIFAWLDPLGDQQLAGIVMKVLAMLLYIPPIIAIFYRWYNSSQRPSPLKVSHVHSKA